MGLNSLLSDVTFIKLPVMEGFANTGRIQYCNMISTIRQKLEVLEDITKRIINEMKCKIDEETNMRRTKEMLLTVSLQQLTQEKEKTTALERNVTDAVSQNIKQSAQIQKLESIKAELQASILEEQSLRHEAMQNVSELQLQLQKMAMKLHEVEGQLMAMESKWGVTPFVQSYSGMPRARSFSADQVLIQKCIKPRIMSHMDYGINRRSSKQGKFSVLKHLRYLTSPKMRVKIMKFRRSTGQIRSAAVEPIIVSPPVISTPEAKVDSVRTMLDVPRSSAVKAVIQEFEKLSPRHITKGAVPKKKLFQGSKQHSLKQQREIGTNKSPVQHNDGATWKPHQSLPVLSSLPLPDVTDEATEYERLSTKRCLSPTVSVGRVKKLRAEGFKSLLPC